MTHRTMTVTFGLPPLGKREIDLLTHAALKVANVQLSYLAEDETDHDLIKHIEETHAAFEAWVDYGRQTFPDQQSGFMLNNEKHWGACLPFKDGDRWEFDVLAGGWAIVRPNGKRFVLRNPKPKDMK